VSAVSPVSGTLIVTGSSPEPASCAAVCRPYDDDVPYSTW
jgi:hypothetical protein